MKTISSGLSFVRYIAKRTVLLFKAEILVFKHALSCYTKINFLILQEWFFIEVQN
jgi:sRNA-binding regulator protein Hfq